MIRLGLAVRGTSAVFAVGNDENPSTPTLEANNPVIEMILKNIVLTRFLVRKLDLN